MSGIIIDVNTKSQKAEGDLTKLDVLASRLQKPITIGLKDSDGSLKRLTANLKGLNSQKVAPKIDLSGIDRMSASIDRMSRNMNRSLSETARNTGRVTQGLGSVATMAKAAFAIGGIYAFMRGLNTAADSLLAVRNRLSLVAKEGENIINTQMRVARVARDTRSELQATAALYTDLSMSMSKYGKSSDQILRVTKTVQQANAMSGQTVESMNAGLMQLNQGLSSGEIRGQELRSVLEQLPVLAKGIRDELKMTTGELLKFAEAGQFTPQVFMAIMESLEKKTDESFGKFQATYAQQQKRFSNSTKLLVGDLNLHYGLSSALGGIWENMAKRVDAAQETIIGNMLNLRLTLKNLRLTEVVESKAIINVGDLLELREVDRFSVYDMMRKYLHGPLRFMQTQIDDLVADYAVDLSGIIKMPGLDNVGAVLRGIIGGVNQLLATVRVTASLAKSTMEQATGWMPRIRLYEMGGIRKQFFLLQGWFYGLLNTASSANVDFQLQMRGIAETMTGFLISDTRTERAFTNIFQAGGLDDLVTKVKEFSAIRAESNAANWLERLADLGEHGRDVTFVIHNLLANLDLLEPKVAQLEMRGIGRLLESMEIAAKSVSRLLAAQFESTIKYVVRMFSLYAGYGMSYLDKFLEAVVNQDTGRSLGIFVANIVPEMIRLIALSFAGAGGAFSDLFNQYIRENLKGLAWQIRESAKTFFLGFVTELYHEVKNNILQALGIITRTEKMLMRSARGGDIASAMGASIIGGFRKITGESTRAAEAVNRVWASVKGLPTRALEFAIKIKDGGLDKAMADFMRLVRRVVDYARIGFGKAEMIVTSFTSKVDKAFFEVYDSVVGHSWWPDLVDGVISHTERMMATAAPMIAKFTSFVDKSFESLKVGMPVITLEGSTLFAKSAVGTIKNEFKNLMDRVISYDYAYLGLQLKQLIGGVVTSALAIAFGGLRAKIFGAITLTSLVLMVLGEKSQLTAAAIGRTLGTMMGNALGIFLAGIPYIIESFIAAIPAILGSLFAGLSPHLARFMDTTIGGLLSAVGGILFSGLHGVIFAAMAGAWLFAGKDAAVQTAKSMFSWLAPLQFDKMLMRKMMPGKGIITAISTGWKDLGIAAGLAAVSSLDGVSTLSALFGSGVFLARAIMGPAVASTVGGMIVSSLLGKIKENWATDAPAAMKKMNPNRGTSNIWQALYARPGDTRSAAKRTLDNTRFLIGRTFRNIGAYRDKVAESLQDKDVSKRWHPGVFDVNEMLFGQRSTQGTAKKAVQKNISELKDLLGLAGPIAAFRSASNKVRAINYGTFYQMGLDMAQFAVGLMARFRAMGAAIAAFAADTLRNLSKVRSAIILIFGLMGVIGSAFASALGPDTVVSQFEDLTTKIGLAVLAVGALYTAFERLKKGGAFASKDMVAKQLAERKAFMKDAGRAEAPFYAEFRANQDARSADLRRKGASERLIRAELSRAASEEARARKNRQDTALRTIAEKQMRERQGTFSLSLLPGEMGARMRQVREKAPGAASAAASRSKDAARSVAGKVSAGDFMGLAAGVGIGLKAITRFTAGGVLKILIGGLVKVGALISSIFGWPLAIAAGVGLLAAAFFGPGNSFFSNLEYVYDKVRELFGLETTTGTGKRVEAASGLRKRDIGGAIFDVDQLVNDIDYTKMTKAQSDMVRTLAKETSERLNTIEVDAAKRGGVNSGDRSEVKSLQKEITSVLERLPSRATESFTAGLDDLEKSMGKTETVWDTFRRIDNERDWLGQISTAIADTTSLWGDIISGNLKGVANHIQVAFGPLGTWIDGAITKPVKSAMEGLSKQVVNFWDKNILTIPDTLGSMMYGDKWDRYRNPSREAPYAEYKEDSARARQYQTFMPVEAAKAIGEAARGVERYREELAYLQRRGYLEHLDKTQRNYAKSVDQARVNLDKARASLKKNLSEGSKEAEIRGRSSAYTADLEGFQKRLGVLNVDTDASLLDRDLFENLISQHKRLEEAKKRVWSNSARATIIADQLAVEGVAKAISDAANNASKYGSVSTVFGDGQELLHILREPLNDPFGLQQSLAAAKAQLEGLNLSKFRREDGTFDNAGAVKEIEDRLFTMRLLEDTQQRMIDSTKSLLTLQSRLQDFGGLSNDVLSRNNEGTTNKLFDLTSDYAKAKKAYERALAPNAPFKNTIEALNKMLGIARELKSTLAIATRDAVANVAENLEGLNNSQQALRIGELTGGGVDPAILASGKKTDSFIGLQGRKTTAEAVIADPAASATDIQKAAKDLVSIEKSMGKLTETKTAKSLSDVLSTLSSIGTEINIRMFSNFSAKAQRELQNAARLVQAAEEKISAEGSAGMSAGMVAALARQSQTAMDKIRDIVSRSSLMAGTSIRDMIGDVMGPGMTGAVTKDILTLRKKIAALDIELDVVVNTNDPAALDKYLNKLRTRNKLERDIDELTTRASRTMPDRLAKLSDLFGIERQLDLLQIFGTSIKGVSDLAFDMEDRLEKALKSGDFDVARNILAQFDKLADSKELIGFATGLERALTSAISMGVRNGFAAVNNVYKDMFTEEGFSRLAPGRRRDLQTDASESSQLDTLLNMDKLPKSVADILNSGLMSGKATGDILAEASAAVMASLGKDLGELTKAPMEKLVDALNLNTAAVSGQPLDAITVTAKSEKNLGEISPAAFERYRGRNKDLQSEERTRRRAMDPIAALSMSFDDPARLFKGKNPKLLKEVQQGLFSEDEDTRRFYNDQIQSWKDQSYNAATQYANATKQAFSSGLNGLLKGERDEGKSALQTFFSRFMDTLTSSILDSFVDGMMTKVTGAPMRELFMKMFDFGQGSLPAKAAKEGATGAVATVSEVAGEDGLFGSIKDGLSKSMESLKEAFSGDTGLMGMLGSVFSGLKDSLGDLLGGLFSGGGDGLSSMFGSLMTVFGFAEGGHVRGPGTGTSDSIPAKLSNGEFVINAKQTKRFLPMLQAINAGQELRLASGGMVTDVSPIAAANATPISAPWTANGGDTHVSLGITGDVTEQTRAVVMRMIPQIAASINSRNREYNR